MSGKELKAALERAKASESVNEGERAIATILIDLIDDLEGAWDRLEKKRKELHEKDQVIEASMLTNAVHHRVAGALDAIEQIGKHLFPDYVKEGDKNGSDTVVGDQGPENNAEASDEK